MKVQLDIKSCLFMTDYHLYLFVVTCVVQHQLPRQINGEIHLLHCEHRGESDSLQDQDQCAVEVGREQGQLTDSQRKNA